MAKFWMEDFDFMGQVEGGSKKMIILGILAIMGQVEGGSKTSLKD